MSLPHANKSLGQHFLTNQNVIDQITSNFDSLADVILEVGPGPGVLTKALSLKNKPLKVIEKDKRFPELLCEFIKDDSITLADALEIDYEKVFSEWQWENQKIWLVSNLPYNISTPLLIKFIQSPSIDMMTLMFQREVADKVFSFDTRKAKAMNSLMALTQTYFEVQLLCKVAPGSFAPPPKVDSAVLSFIRKPSPSIALDEFKSFEKFLRHVFKFKRKQIGKVLKSYHSDHSLIEQALMTSNIDRTKRAESFNLNTIQTLYRCLSRSL